MVLVVEQQEILVHLELLVLQVDLQLAEMLVQTLEVEVVAEVTQVEMQMVVQVVVV